MGSLLRLLPRVNECAQKTRRHGGIGPIYNTASGVELLVRSSLLFPPRQKSILLEFVDEWYSCLNLTVVGLAVRPGGQVQRS